MAYAKLFSSILSSSIWSEDDKTRIMWITMLAMADKNGEVMGSEPGLARIAGMTTDDALMAIAKLESPDEYSRTKEEQGKRIVRIDGGWEIVNYLRYRALATKEDEIEKARKRQERRRERQKSPLPSRDVTPCHAPVTQNRDIAEAEAEAEAPTFPNTLSGTSRGDVFTRQSGEPPKTPPAPAPAPDFSEFRSAGDLADVSEWISRLHGNVRLSRSELDAIRDNAGCILSLSEYDRRMIEAFQRVPRSQLNSGAAWHRPDKCLFWIRDFSEVLRAARRWAEKNWTAPKKRNAHGFD